MSTKNKKQQSTDPYLKFGDHATGYSHIGSMLSLRETWNGTHHVNEFRLVFFAYQVNVANQ
jgi:hypothetical protein